jgi:hypothetical protein
MRTFRLWLLVVPLLAAADGTLSAAAADCICRAQGREFELGQSACLQTPRGARIATCGMVLNNTSWQFSETACVVSDLPPRTAGTQPRLHAAHHGH